MKKLSLTALWLLFSCFAFAQVVDRYPYIQQPTETSVLIAWNTATAGIGTLSWGSSPSALSNSVSDAAAVQKHALELANLQPNTQYYYQVTTDQGYSSAVEHFWTAKPLAERQIKFLHYGDCGYNNSIQNQLAGLMEQEVVDFAVVTGDVDQGIGDAYDEVFFGPYADMLAKDCHFTAIGNHDIIANNGADFFDAFYQPTNNQQLSEHYYSFTWGPAKFICMDSNEDYSPGSDQHNFILDELRCRDQEWVFVFFHHPPWTNAWDGLYYVPLQPYYQYDGEDAMRTALVPYFEQYKVDFILNGHSHCYQRGHMNGVEYVISGGAGSSTPDTRKCNTFPNYGPCAPNIQNEIYINQYVRFSIDGDRVSYACVDQSGAVVDSTDVTKAWSPYSATVTASGASSAGASDGSATASASGGIGPYSYTWSNGATGATASNLAPGSYTVTITNGTGCERTETVTVGIGVANDLPLKRLDLSMSPNPAQELCRLYFENRLQESMRLEVIDIKGRQVQLVEGITSESITLHTANYAEGIYVLRLTGGNKVFTGKLVVTH